MSVSTTGFVLTVIENTLIDLVRKYATKDTPIFRDSTSKLPRIECNLQSQFFNIYFTVKNESRILIVHFGCDCDYKEYGESKIIWE